MKKVTLLFVALLAAFNTPLCAQKNTGYQTVLTKKSNKDTIWAPFTAKTIDKLPGFKQKAEPALNQYGSWTDKQEKATGFFRTQKIDGRWWIIDPAGYRYINKGVAVYRPGASDHQKEVLKAKYQTPEKWADVESDMLRKNGFNGAGCWSDVDLLINAKRPMVHTVIVSPMASYKSDHVKLYGGKYKAAGWQGYRFDLVMVFDPQFDKYIDNSIKEIAKYKDDRYLLGYFTDNELPWLTDALTIHLEKLAHDEPGYIAARKWLDARKGLNSPVADITEQDKLAFSGFYFEAYVKKVAAAIKKYDPNHMYLGCRFNQQSRQELTNPEIFRVAGKYMDVISINHYRMWEPDSVQMSNWEKWSGKPFLITEWYTKGQDSGLPNNGGAGWIVKTQQDRGYFYQNFTLQLIKSKNCVGWHWFTYQDNDPKNMNIDESNRDSNKGIVNSEFEPYQPLLKQMKLVNTNVYNLINYFDANKKAK